MINPNSYVNVGQVLGEIRKMCSSEHAWSAVGCEGNPYVIAHRLRDKSADKSTLILPGAEHFEMNMTKCLFRILWPLGLKELVTEMMGYSSAKSQEAALRCSDHHKAWGLLIIVHEQCMRLLVNPYVSECASSGVLPTVGGYYNWSSRVTNVFFVLLRDINFIDMMGLLMFREGIRKNQSSLALSGRISFSPLFYSCNMTTYQEIHFRDMVTRVKAPETVGQFIAKNEAFTLTGSADKHEGGDFILENRNKRTKMWAPPGVPTHEQWQRVCRTLDTMEKVLMWLIYWYFFGVGHFLRMIVVIIWFRFRVVHLAMCCHQVML